MAGYRMVAVLAELSWVVRQHEVGLENKKAQSSTSERMDRRRSLSILAGGGAKEEINLFLHHCYLNY